MSRGGTLVLLEPIVRGSRKWPSASFSAALQKSRAHSCLFSKTMKLSCTAVGRPREAFV